MAPKLTNDAIGTTRLPCFSEFESDLSVSKKRRNLRFHNSNYPAPPTMIKVPLIASSVRRVLFLWWIVNSFEDTAASVVHGLTTTTSYNYVTIGSNMLPATMTSLRNLDVVTGSTAVVLSNYELAFDVPGPRWIEPSASVVYELPFK